MSLVESPRRCACRATTGHGGSRTLFSRPSHVFPGDLTCTQSLSFIPCLFTPTHPKSLQAFESPATASNRLTSNMSSSIADTIGKQKRRSVKKLEKFQGFDFANGLASISRATRDRQGPIGDLYESLKSINVMRDISLHQLRREARELFDLLGPHLWPRDTSTAWWLLKPPNSDYPRYLYYDDREDREQYVLAELDFSAPTNDDCRLWEYFSEMVQEKRLNHEDHVSRCTKSRGQSEDSTSFSNEAGFADGVRYERAPTASMRRGSAYAAVQSPAAQSEVCTLQTLES